MNLVPLYRSSIGFDRFNDLFESMLSPSESAEVGGGGAT